VLWINRRDGGDQVDVRPDSLSLIRVQGLPDAISDIIRCQRPAIAPAPVGRQGEGDRLHVIRDLPAGSQAGNQAPIRRVNVQQGVGQRPGDSTRYWARGAEWIERGDIFPAKDD